MKKLIHDISNGKNLENNLNVYKKMMLQTYRDYAALELTFSAYTMVEEIVEEKPALALKEKETIDKICQGLSALGKGGSQTEVIAVMKELRQEITNKMDLFTAYTDRLICYEYVLNRMELKFLSAKELDAKCKEINEEQFLQRLMLYLFGDKDQSVMKDKLRLVMGQVPVHMTKSKLFERIREALTLYKDGDKNALDDFIYMLSTSAMLYEPQHFVGEYPEFEEILHSLEKADYTSLTEKEFLEMQQLLEEGSQSIHEITDFYYSLQKVVNGIYAMAVLSSYESEESKLQEAMKSIWVCLAIQEYRDEMLVPLEGRIEEYVMKANYLESILPEIISSYEKELENLELKEFFTDYSLITKLLSDSLFIDLAKSEQLEMVDSSYMKEVTESLLEKLEEKMGKVNRPVKKAMIGQIIEKLPITFSNTDEVKTYLSTNLLGCQDKAEKIIVMSMLEELMQEEQEW